jgi:ATP-dependent protease La (LON) substrate-binding domain
VAVESRNEFSFFGAYPVVISDTVIFPSLTFPLKVETSASLRALEESLKKDGMVFLAGGAPTLDEDSAPDERFRIGTLCRVRRTPVHSFGGGDLIAEGLERACAWRFAEADGFLSAEVFYDLSPDLTADEEELKTLDREVRRLLGQLRALLPEELGSEEKLFYVQDITSPSRLADQTAFLLYLLRLISPEQQRVILETFPADLRLRTLSEILTEAVETEQLVALLMKRMRRRYPTRPLLPQKFLDEFERGLILHAREFHPNITALSRRQYVSTFLLQAVDEALDSLHIEAGVKVKQDRCDIHGERFDASQLKKSADTVAKRNRAAAKGRLGVHTGPPEGTPSKRKGKKESSDRAHAKLKDKKSQLTQAAYKLFVRPSNPPSLNYQLLAKEIGKSTTTVGRWVADVGWTRDTLLQRAREYHSRQK